MKIKLAFIVMLLITVIALLAACSQPAPAPTPAPKPTPSPTPSPAPAPSPTTTAAPGKPAGTVTLSFNWEAAYGYANCLVWPFRPGGRFEQLVTKYSGGGIKLDIKDKLYDLNNSIFAIADGRIQAGTQSVPAASGTYPLLDFGGIPGFISDVPNSAYEWASAFLDPRMMTIWDKYSTPAGFKIIGSAISMSNNAEWGKRAIKTVPDFKGLKTRASGRTQTAALNALGASPVTLSAAEIEDALYRGTVDAITTGISYGSERGLIDICPYVSIWPITPVFAQFIAVNAKTFAGLDPYYQQALLKAGSDMTYEMTPVIEQMQISYTLWIQASSKKITLVIPDKSEVDKAMAVMGPVIDDWIKISGPFAKDVLNIASEYAHGPALGLVKNAIK